MCIICESTNIQSDISERKTLKICNAVNKLPDIDYSNISKLDAKDSRIERLPIRMRNLVILDLTNTCIVSVPRLPKLKFLGLRETKIKKLPKSLDSLIMLDIRHSKNLLIIPNYPKIEKIYCGGADQLKEIPNPDIIDKTLPPWHVHPTDKEPMYDLEPIVKLRDSIN